MSSSNYFDKDPQEILDYTINWAAALATSEIISTSTWTLDAGITAPVSPVASITTSTTTVWLTGGTEGRVYGVKNTITTNQSRTLEQTIYIQVAQR